MGCNNKRLHRNKKKIISLVGIILLCGITIGCLQIFNQSREDYYVFADEETTEEATQAELTEEENQEESVDDMKKTLESLKTSKHTAQDLLRELENYKQDVASYVDQLDTKQIELEDDLVNMQKQQSGIQENLDKVQVELDSDRRKEKQQYDAMKLRIKYLYEHGNYSFLDALAGSTSFGDMLNRTTIAKQVQKYDSKLLEGYRKALASISEKETYISQRQAELAQITLDIQTEKDSVDAILKDKYAELKSYEKGIDTTKGVIENYEKNVAEQEQMIAAAEAQAEEFYDDEIPENYSGGKFLWPVPGHYKISSKFGYRIHPIFGTRRLHNGIDISCPTGCGIYAAADGVVTVSTYSGSAGNYIVITHDSSLSTVYMHNSKLLVSVGDKVTRGEKIALAGSTGWSTGAHCHFSVRKDGNYVNPIPYLKSTNSSEEADYSESDVADTTNSNSDDASEDTGSNIQKDDSKHKDVSEYTTEADDVGDNGKKSSTIKDDSDEDSE